MYDKEAINALFREFIFTEDDKFLAQLIEELTPMIDVILSRWGAHKRHWDDTRQQILLMLWRNLRNFEIDRTKQTINPTSYLFFLIRTYATRSFRSVQGKCPVYMLSLDDILSQRGESANYF